MNNWNYNLLNWFSKMGKLYYDEHLKKIAKNKERLKSDNIYSLKMFLNCWAYERQDAPLGFRIAAIKTIDLLKKKIKVNSNDYKNFYKGKLNEKNNPGMDNRLYKLNLCSIVNTIEEGDLCSAFKLLDIKGIGPKIKSFYFRDLVDIFKSEQKFEMTIDNYLYLFPVDVWITSISENIDYTPNNYINKLSKYGLDRTKNRDGALLYDFMVITYLQKPGNGIYIFFC